MNTDYSVYVLSLKEKFRFLAIGYICSFAVAYLFYHSLYLSAVAGLVPVLLIKRYSIALAEKRKAFLLIQFMEVLASTCEILNDKMSIEKEIKTLVAQKKLEGKIITVMPLCVIIFLNIISPDYLQVLYSTFAGRIVMTLALAGMATAYLMTERLTDIEV